MAHARPIRIIPELGGCIIGEKRSKLKMNAT